MLSKNKFIFICLLQGACRPPEPPGLCEAFRRGVLGFRNSVQRTTLNKVGDVDPEPDLCTTNAASVNGECEQIDTQVVTSWATIVNANLVVGIFHVFHTIHLGVIDIDGEARLA